MSPSSAGTPPAIATRGLTKQFDKVRALDGVDMSVPRGSVYGFLGPNGAGKTTALRILAGLARPTSGSAFILGRDVVAATNEVRSLLGFLPDVPGFYPWMTAPEFLRFSGELFGLGGAELEDRVGALLALSGLEGVNNKIGGYSRGMKQRLGIAQALINAPELLMLDEPTSALDPIGRKEVLEMIGALGGRTTVFFSTHILSDVERVCDHVAILNKGRIVTQASIAELKDRRGEDRVVLEVEGPPGDAASGDAAARLAGRLEGSPWLLNIERTGNGRLLLAVADLPAAQRAIPQAVGALELGLRRMEIEEASLENVFVELVGESAL